MTDINKNWKRDFDVYDRIEKLGIDLGKKEEVLPPSTGARLCRLTFTPSGLVFTSGAAIGKGAVTDDDTSISEAKAAGREAGIGHLRALHWALEPLGNLNDVWYCASPRRDQAAWSTF